MVRGYMLIPSCVSTLIITKRSQPLRSPSASSFKRFKKLFLNFSISLTCMLIMTASDAAICESATTTLSNSSSLGGRDEIQHREMLHVQDLVHAFQAESALAVQEVGDVGLLEAGLLRQTQASEFPSVDAFPEGFAEIFLKHAEFHRRSITRYNSTLLLSI